MLPALPRRVWSPHGDIRVSRPRRLAGDQGEQVYGEWRQVERTICVVAKLRRDAAWPVFFHEMAHAELDDYGVIMEHELLERTCDALGLARAAWFRRVVETHGADAALSALGAVG